jgi:DNA primase
MACCPAHDDKSPSLLITESPDGKKGIHCFAGCGGADVMVAIGLSLEDLYPEPISRDYSKGLPDWKKNELKKELSGHRLLVEIAKTDAKKGLIPCQSDQLAIRNAMARIPEIIKRLTENA